MGGRDVWHGVMCDVRHPRPKEARWLAQGAADNPPLETVVLPRGEGSWATDLRLYRRVCR